MEPIVIILVVIILVVVIYFVYRHVATPVIMTLFPPHHPIPPGIPSSYAELYETMLTLVDENQHNVNGLTEWYNRIIHSGSTCFNTALRLGVQTAYADFIRSYNEFKAETEKPIETLYHNKVADLSASLVNSLKLISELSTLWQTMVDEEFRAQCHTTWIDNYLNYEKEVINKFVEISQPIQQMAQYP